MSQLDSVVRIAVVRNTCFPPGADLIFDTGFGSPEIQAQ